MDIALEENARMNSVVVTVMNAIKTTSEITNGTDDEDAPKSIIYIIIVPILFGLITLIGTAGNGLVIYVILVERRMRTVTNILLLNLSLADLSFVLICPPFTAYVLVTTDGWPFGGAFCKLMHYLLNVTAYVTVYTLVLISVTRYMTIVHNVRTARLRTRVNIVLMIFATWVVMLSVNVPILIAYDSRMLSGKLQCDHYGPNFGRKLFGTFFAFAYLLPLLVIAALSASILLHIHQHRPSTINKKTKSQTKKRQASRLIILVVVIFALFWLPVHIHLLVAYFGNISKSTTYETISVLWNCLAYFNSCINPIIYAFASQEFRDGFRRAIYCRRHSGRADDNMTAVTNIEHPHNGANVELLQQRKEVINNEVESTC